MAAIRAAAEADLGAIRALLGDAGLPTSDLAVSNPRFSVLCEDGRIVAAGALQRFGSFALVRSVVVWRERRGAGLGRAIIRELEKVARAEQIGQLILLTQTAAEFFSNLGFHVIERTDAPHEIQGSEEFRALCPASAICMAKSVTE